MTEFSKFPRNISCRDIDDLVRRWKNALPNIFGGVIERGINLRFSEKSPQPQSISIRN